MTRKGGSRYFLAVWRSRKFVTYFCIFVAIQLLWLLYINGGIAHGLLHLHSVVVFCLYPYCMILFVDNLFIFTWSASQWAVRLLWQPSGCMAIFVIFVVLLSENKYDDDDDDDDVIHHDTLVMYSIHCFDHRFIL